MPVCRFIHLCKCVLPVITGPDKAKACSIVATKAERRAHSFDTVGILVAIDNDIKIIISQKTPTIRANTLMIFLNQAGATFGIPTILQAPQPRPLVKPALAVTIRCIIVIAIAFDFRVIFLILESTNHFTNIQIFSHYRNRSIFSRKASVSFTVF